MPNEDESLITQNLLIPFQDLMIRREKLIRLAENYVTFISSKKEGLLDVENLGITGAVKNLPGYNERTQRCVAFTNSIKVQIATLDPIELRNIKAEIDTKNYSELKTTFERMIKMELTPINRVTLTKFWIDENLTGEFYKNTSLLLNIVVAFIADIVAWAMIIFSSITSGGMKNRIEQRQIEKDYYEKLAIATDDASLSKKKYHLALLKALGRTKAAKIMSRAFKK